MTVEEKRWLLKMYNQFCHIARTWEERSEELKSTMLLISPQLSALPKSHSGKDRYAEYAARRDEMEREYFAALTGKAAVEMAMNKLPHKEERIIRWHYVYEMGMKEIARKMKYSEIAVKKKCRSAIEQMEIREDVYEECADIFARVATDI